LTEATGVSVNQQRSSAQRRHSRAALVVAGGVLHVALATLAPRALAAQAPDAARKTSGPTISGMRAHLFHNKSGKLSDVDLLGPSEPALWNTIAGPDAAKSTLVVVEVSGPPSGTFTGYFGPETKYMVRLVAREGGAKVLLDQRQLIPVLSEQGKVSLALLLHQSGCRPIRLTASLVGVRPGKAVERSLDFACGE
jgi:hypothetical protein